MERNLAVLMETLGVEAGNKSVFIEAFTHKSYSAERGLNYSNQRLEFLGDAVLQIIITEYLYNRYGDCDEGRLTKMRSAMARQQALAALASDLELGQYVRLGKGERASGGAERASTLCDVFEALAGALYVEGGLQLAKKVLAPLIEKRFSNPEELITVINPKGMLQELTQKNSQADIPEYVVESKNGPDHDCRYSVSVRVRDKIVGKGVGRSRKSAEMAAAAAALNTLRERGEE